MVHASVRQRRPATRNSARNKLKSVRRVAAVTGKLLNESESINEVPVFTRGQRVQEVQFRMFFGSANEKSLTPIAIGSLLTLTIKMV